MKPDKIMFCPKCKSPNVQKEITFMLIFGATQEWKCNNCGFKGYIFPQATKIQYNKNKSIKKKK